MFRACTNACCSDRGGCRSSRYSSTLRTEEGSQRRPAVLDGLRIVRLEHWRSTQAIPQTLRSPTRRACSTGAHPCFSATQPGCFRALSQAEATHRHDSWLPRSDRTGRRSDASRYFRSPSPTSAALSIGLAYNDGRARQLARAKPRRAELTPASLRLRQPPATSCGLLSQARWSPRGVDPSTPHRRRGSNWRLALENRALAGSRPTRGAIEILGLGRAWPSTLSSARPLRPPRPQPHHAARVRRPNRHHPSP